MTYMEETRSINDKLFQAIKGNHFWLLNSLCDHGARLNCVNGEGLSPVDYAYKLGHQKLAEFLKSKKKQKETSK